MRILMAGVAALALAASGAVAQGNGNGKGNGNGNGNGNSAAAKPDRGNGPTRGGGEVRGNGGKENRGGGNNGNAGNRGDGGPDRDVARSNNGNGNKDRVERRVERQVERAADRGPARNVQNRGNGKADRVDVRYDDRNVRYDDRNGYDRTRSFLSRDRDRSYVDGCPPGLAKKRNGCTPPGLAKQQQNAFGYEYRPRLFGLSNYRDDRYYYDDGYLVRLGDGGRISGYIPLLGGALSLGQTWPQGYNSYDVSPYYVDYYNLGGNDRYRYADNVLYRVDSQDMAITSIAALLTGDDITIGQPMPRGYDVYNVPYGYRDQYYDTPEANYRYSDGYVYRIDPTTQLVAAAIDLLI